MNALTVVMAVCAITVTALLVRREFLGGTAETGEPVRVRIQKDWMDYARDGHIVGPSGATVTVVVFSDFECPFCRELAHSLGALRRKYPDDLRVVFRHFPLRNHRGAVPAARASECASEQGRFVEMHDALFAAPDSIALSRWSWFADRAGIPDISRFDRCVQMSASIEALARDTVAGNRLGVRGTPTVLVDSLRFDGAPTRDSLEAIVLRSRRR